MKKVLVITYYWPPSGGAGVQRWLKFTKYLPENGWGPVVYTPENPEAPVDDPTLMKDIPAQTKVVRRPIWEPYQLYKLFMGLKGENRINAGFLTEEEKSKNKEGLSVWIRGNLFIPDARRFWIGPSVRFLKKYLRRHPVDALISTGPPHSMHLIARKLARSTGLPWIADFRDPWTEIDFYHQLRLSRFADSRHRILEKKVLREASRVIVIGKTMAERFEEIGGISPLVIPNGYDDADFHRKSSGPVSSGKENRPSFPIVHIGAMNRDRNHPVFWQALAGLLSRESENRPEIRIILIGKVDIAVRQTIRESGLDDRVEIISSLPHDQIIPYLKSASVLYLPINRTPNARMIQTGKLFEYLAAGRPILGIGPADGDAAEIIRDCRAGIMIDFDDRATVERTLEEWLRQQQKGNLDIRVSGAEKYTRRHLTSLLAKALEEAYVESSAHRL